MFRGRVLFESSPPPSVKYGVGNSCRVYESRFLLLIRGASRFVERLWLIFFLKLLVTPPLFLLDFSSFSFFVRSGLRRFFNDQCGCLEENFPDAF